VAGDFGLALMENLNEVTDADLAAVHKVEEAEAGGVGQRGEQRCESGDGAGTRHPFIIYALTDLSRGEYIRVGVCVKTSAAGKLAAQT
jgi:hypothetical protein